MSSQKSGPVGINRGDFFRLVISRGGILVVKSGWNTMGKKWEKVVRGLCGVQHETDILTKTNKLTNIYKQNSPL